MSSIAKLNLILLIAIVALYSAADVGQAAAGAASARNGNLARLSRSAAEKHPHQVMMHNHLSRKVFDRACAASKDTIDEIFACLTSNDVLMKSVKASSAKECYKEAYGQEFNADEVLKHKELICNNRDKFESMTACIYKKTADSMDAKEMEKLTETLVDVGMCIINALDG